ncbi:amidohydrolase family protein [uncultured Amnibacterium sp.]|uniref:amidohydrolase family protein n=1 Tax=uncultured Amnibacterium sp. TaxID=1631851 RepID=UPI0035CB8B3B
MRIDVHAHYWPKSYIDVMVEEGRPDAARAAQPDDLDARLAEMDSVGVERQYFSAIGLNTVMPTASGSVRAARHLNDLYVDIRERTGGRMDGYATITLPFVDEAIAEAKRALEDLHLVGIALPCYIDGRTLDADEFEPLWAYLDTQKAVVYVHPSGSDSANVAGLADFGLNMLLGSTMQVAMTPLRLGIRGVTTRYPNVRFIFAVMGGTLPYLWERFETNLIRGLKAVEAAGPNVPPFFSWMKGGSFTVEDPMRVFRSSFYYDTSVQDIPASLGLARTSVGIDHVLLGSDATFASLTEAVHLVEGTPDLTAEEKTAILDENAERLFRSAGVLA